MIDWMKRKISRGQVKSTDAVEYPKGPPEKLHRHCPPIVLRVGDVSSISDDNHRQFLSYGWRYGKDTPLTQPFDRMMFEGLNGAGEYIVLGVTLPIPDGFHVRAAQVAQHEGIDYYGDALICLFIPGDVRLKGMLRSSSHVGGPTTELMEMIQYLAMRFESRIISIETALDGDVLILFSPWNKQYTLENYNMRWKEERITRAFDNGPLDDTDGKVEDSKGSGDTLS